MDTTFMHIIAVSVILWVIANFVTGCAVASPGGYTAVLGPKSTHELYVGTPMDYHTEQDKRELGAVLRRVK